MPPTPSNTKEALNGPWSVQWLAAHEKERQGIADSGTWRVLPQGYKGRFTGSGWAYRVSIGPDGLLKFRSRIVGRGYSQVPGLDYFGSFSPTVSVETLLIIIHIAAAEDMEMRNLDVSNAYLESPMDTDLVMLLPETEWVNGE